MNNDVFEYIERVGRACCGRLAVTLNTYREMREEFMRLPRSTKGYCSKYLPKCTATVAEIIGKSYTDCYEAFVIAEFYDCCSRYLPAVFNLIAPVFERNSEYVAQLKELCSQFEDAVNSNEELKGIKERGLAVTGGASRVFLNVNTVLNEVSDLYERYPMDETAFESVFTRIRWVLDMLKVGEKSRD